MESDNRPAHSATGIVWGTLIGAALWGVILLVALGVNAGAIAGLIVGVILVLYLALGYYARGPRASARRHR